jgi:hypothetical protein
MARMVIESGVAQLTPDARDIEEVTVGYPRLTGESAQYAIEALGRKQSLVINGIEYELDELRLRTVD